MEQREINIEVQIAERPLVVKALPSQQEQVNKAAEMINTKINELREQYTTEDKQEYLAMALISLGLDNLNQRNELDEASQNLSSLDQKLNLFFDDVPTGSTTS